VTCSVRESLAHKPETTASAVPPLVQFATPPRAAGTAATHTVRELTSVVWNGEDLS
jgi:hypothetical protein